MHWHHPSPKTPEECLAWDDAFLESVEAGGPEVLWVWEPPRPFVVLGYGQVADREAKLGACAHDGIPVLRRISGGGSVVQAPGCLCYGVALRIAGTPELATIGGANQWILGRILTALQMASGTACEYAVRGATDLAVVLPWGDKKIAGHAQRRRQRALLFHGALLANADLTLLDRYLWHPSAEPDYRRGRRHSDFVANSNLGSPAAVGALKTVWRANSPYLNPPYAEVAQAQARRYSLISWNLRR